MSIANLLTYKNRDKPCLGLKSITSWSSFNQLWGFEMGRSNFWRSMLLFIAYVFTTSTYYHCMNVLYKILSIYFFLRLNFFVNAYDLTLFSKMKFLKTMWKFSNEHLHFLTEPRRALQPKGTQWFPRIGLFVVRAISLGPCRRPIEFLTSSHPCRRLSKIPNSQFHKVKK